MKTSSHEPLIEALKKLLTERQASTQEEVCAALEGQGHVVNQSTISRLLRKIGAIKVENEKGEIVYSLPREPAPPTMSTPLKHLITDIVANETLVVVFTSPGSASMIGRILDYKQASSEILGTIAGDDTVFVAPKSIKNIRKMLQEIKELLLV
jgi:transcriptional regulator of arginine metabolism